MANLSDIYAQIQANAISAMKEILKQGKKLAEEYIQTQWYDKYDPVVYNRTFDMLDSLDVDIEIKGNEITGYLYVKDEIHQKSNSWSVYNRTFEEIHEWFATGKAIGEDREGKQLDAIKYTKEQLIDMGIALDIIKETFWKRGFKIK